MFNFHVDDCVEVEYNNPVFIIMTDDGNRKLPSQKAFKSKVKAAQYADNLMKNGLHGQQIKEATVVELSLR